VRVASADISDRIEVVVDPEAEPTDWDQALAVFLLRYVRSQAISTANAAAAEPVDHNSTTAAKEELK